MDARIAAPEIVAESVNLCRLMPAGCTAIVQAEARPPARDTFHKTGASRLIGRVPPARSHRWNGTCVKRPSGPGACAVGPESEGTGSNHTGGTHDREPAGAADRHGGAQGVGSPPE